MLIAVTTRDAAREAAGRELTSTLKNWSADVLLASGESGDVRLEELRLPLDEASVYPPSPIEQAGEDLTARAAAGTIGRLDRRDPLVERVLAALSADGRCSVMLVRPGDVGKSALTNRSRRGCRPATSHRR